MYHSFGDIRGVFSLKLLKIIQKFNIKYLKNYNKFVNEMLYQNNRHFMEII